MTKFILISQTAEPSTSKVWDFSFLIMDIYSLSRKFWDYSFENPDKIKPNHIAMYFFAIEHCNRLGWKEKFGFPTSMVMDAISIKNWRTYSKTLNELVEFGFIKMIETSKNQYSSNIIAIVKNTKAQSKALDKALIKHSQKQNNSTVKSIDSIDIQDYNNTNLQDTDIPPTAFSFYKSLISLGAESKLVNEWMEVRKKKKSTNTETALNGFIREMEKCNLEINEALRICVEKSWAGLNSNWIKDSDISKLNIIQGETLDQKAYREHVEQARKMMS